MMPAFGCPICGRNFLRESVEIHDACMVRSVDPIIRHLTNNMANRIVTPMPDSTTTNKKNANSKLGRDIL